MTELSVIKDRDYWIGGSDIPAIMNKSSFSNPYKLMMDKLDPQDDNEFMQKYIDFGNTMEVEIRNYINETYKTNYEPTVKSDRTKRLRANVDGYDKSADIELLEIKTYGDTLRLEEYELQIQLYMYVFDVTNCMLVLYKRESADSFSFDDFNMTFNEKNLTLKLIYRDDELIKNILSRVERFIVLLDNQRSDNLTKMEFNIEYFDEMELILSQINQLDSIMTSINQLKEYEKEAKKIKEFLRTSMIKNDIRSIDTDLYKVTAGEDSTVTKFDTKSLELNQPDVYNKYLKESKRKGSLTITKLKK